MNKEEQIVEVEGKIKRNWRNLYAAIAAIISAGITFACGVFVAEKIAKIILLSLTGGLSLVGLTFAGIGLYNNKKYSKELNKIINTIKVPVEEIKEEKVPEQEITVTKQIQKEKSTKTIEK